MNQHVKSCPEVVGPRRRGCRRDLPAPESPHPGHISGRGAWPRFLSAVLPRLPCRYSRGLGADCFCLESSKGLDSRRCRASSVGVSKDYPAAIRGIFGGVVERLLPRTPSSSNSTQSVTIEPTLKCEDTLPDGKSE